MKRSPLVHGVMLLAVAPAFAADPSSLPPTAAAGATAVNTAIVPAPLDWHHWRRRHDELAQLAAKERPRVLFLGDSITENWSHDGRAAWEKHIAPLGAANFGIAADRTQGLLWRLEHGDYGAMAPEVVVLLIGTNNLKESRNTIDETVEGIQAVLAAIEDAMPQAKVLLISLLPCNYEDCGPHGAAIDPVNARLAGLANERRIVFLDVSHLYRDQRGVTDRERMPDGLHPSQRGYEALAETLRPSIRLLLVNGSSTSLPVDGSE